jgi:hypothetical protein
MAHQVTFIGGPADLQRWAVPDPPRDPILVPTFTREFVGNHGDDLHTPSAVYRLRPTGYTLHGVEHWVALWEPGVPIRPHRESTFDPERSPDEAPGMLLSELIGREGP